MLSQSKAATGSSGKNELFGSFHRDSEATKININHQDYLIEVTKKSP